MKNIKILKKINCKFIPSNILNAFDNNENDKTKNSIE